MAQIFLSYASEDRDQVAAVYQRLLDEGFEPWMDQHNLGPGDVWEREIQQVIKTADIVLVFLSHHSVNQRRYVQREFTWIEDAWLNVPEGRMHTIPVRLEACDIPEAFQKFQCVDLFAEGSLERLVRALHKALPIHNEPDTVHVSARHSGPPGPFSSRLSAVASSWERGHLGRFQSGRDARAPRKTRTWGIETGKLNGPAGPLSELTVVLQVEGDTLTRRYYHRQQCLYSHSIDWQELADVLQEWHRDTTPRHLSDAFRQALFQALFAPVEEVVKDRLFAGESPFFRPMRLRLHIASGHGQLPAHDLLVTLPWHLAGSQGQTLRENAWTFEHVAQHPENGAAQFTLYLQAPFHALLIAPTHDTVLLRAEHLDDLKGLVRDTWPVSIDFVHTAHDDTDITACYRTHRPKLVYVYGLATLQQDTLMVQLRTNTGQSTAVSVTTLLEQQQHRRAEIVFLNLLYDPAQPLRLGTLLARLSQRVPLLISQTVAITEAHEAQRTFRQWLKALLEDGAPLAALHEHGHVSAVAWGAFGQCEIMPTSKRYGIPPERLPHLLLNRTQERTLANQTVDYLTERRERRVGCLLAFAEADNRIELFAEQVQDYLQRHAQDKVHVKLNTVHVPPEWEVPTREAFELTLRRKFNLEEGLLGKVLQRALQRVGQSTANTSGKKIYPLLLLDWGVWQPADATHIGPVLHAWTAFCEQALSLACSPALRVLSLFAVECATPHHATIRQEITNLRRTFRQQGNRAFYLEESAHLNVVTQDELEDFFYDHAEALGCASADGTTLADHIYRKTDGRYADILRLIQALQDDGPALVLDRWQHEPSLS